MRTPTPMVDAVAFTINRDVVVDIYPANEVCPAQFARGLEAGLAWRMWDNGATRDQIARAVGCSRRGVRAVIEHGRNNR